MKRISFATMAAACVAVVLVAGTASAQLPAAQSTCRKTIAKVVTKYQASLIKSVALCNKLRNLNKAPYNALNCNDAATAANVKGTLSLTKGKNAALIKKLCFDVPTLKGTVADTNAVLALYPRCPSPASTVDDGGLTTGIDDWTEMANCEMALSEGYVSRLAAQAFGAPALPVTVKGPIYNCSFAIGKSLGKTMSTYAKVRTICQGLADKTAGATLDYSCATADPVSLIGTANTALNTAIDTYCNGTPATLAGMGACGQTKDQLKKCITDRMVKRLGGGLVGMAYALPDPSVNHPGSADVIINAGYGEQLTHTELDSGYTGFGHNVDLEDGYLGGVLMGPCDQDGKNCPVSLDKSPAGKKYAGYSTCRCANDATVSCDVINGADATHCGGNNCYCMFGPPLPLSAANAPVCVVNRFQSDFSGNTGEVGEYDVVTRTAAVVHLGLGQTRPCPTCEGDLTANDGTRGGTCDGGTRDGLPCDVNATSDFGSVSFDCLPSLAANISGTGLKMGLTFTDGTSTITAAIPTGALCTAGTCHCAQCSGDPSVGCSSNADCIAVSAGTCTNASGGAGKQNSCDALICDDDGTGTNQGVCGGATPIRLFCDGQLRGNGEGYLSCDAGGDPDCRALDTDCGDGTPGSCGTCGGAGTSGHGGFGEAKCFLPTVTATGIPGIFGSEGVASFCSANTSNAGVNQAGGLPGPGRVRLDFDFDLYCSDHSTPYDLPGGLNCP